MLDPFYSHQLNLEIFIEDLLAPKNASTCLKYKRWKKIDWVSNINNFVCFPYIHFCFEVIKEYRYSHDKDWLFCLIIVLSWEEFCLKKNVVRNNVYAKVFDNGVPFLISNKVSAIDWSYVIEWFVLAKRNIHFFHRSTANSCYIMLKLKKVGTERSFFQLCFSSYCLFIKSNNSPPFSPLPPTLPYLTSF